MVRLIRRLHSDISVAMSVETCRVIGECENTHRAPWPPDILEVRALPLTYRRVAGAVARLVSH